ncbi:preprotein translocase subunit SecA [Candidatus Uhrbacteria bacterium]|nr:preprotein translocase subunit SecA [Candidatus Uhrbacteria bacterium]
MNFLANFFGDPNKKVIEELRAIVDTVNAREGDFSHITNDELRSQTARLRERLKKGEMLDTLLSEAFACVREAAKRILKQRHFDVQLMGGVVLHRGQIAEMRTGEGKTLTATAPVYLNALTGKGVHVVTVNDYLAKRDAVWMGRVYHALGLSIGCIQHEAAFLFDPTYQAQAQRAEENADSEQTASYEIEHDFLRPCTRKEAYAADITYGTNNEFGFDYLRDNLVQRLDQMVQRKPYFAIVDEVDSILIDEARTPLIISAPAEEPPEIYYRYAELIAKLNENEDFNIDEKMRAATLTEAGLQKMEKWLGLGDLYTTANLEVVQHLEQGLKARALFKKDKDYVVKEGEVIIIDEFTGRMMYGRRYSEGLHQAIEAKEGVKIQRESQTFATITFQNYFRLYEKLAGMTGTAATEAEEFAKIYKLEVVVVPTNREMVRADQSDRVYKNERGKFNAVIADVKARHAKGQPVLIGTISIEKNELLSKLLEREGIPHEMLNAKNHEREALIIAQAGRYGAVTIATNMAGRGVDIILGGNPSDEEEARRVREAGGLHVLGTERHESRRIDNQLRGRAGRQGDPGSSQFYISLEDDLLRIFGSEKIKGFMDKLGMPEDMPIEYKLISKSIEEAQKKVESHNFDIRKHLVEYDDIINKQRDVIYRKRRETLEQFLREIQKQTGITEEGKHKPTLRQMIFEMVEEEIERVVLYHTASEAEQEWNLKEIYEVVNTIFPMSEEVRVAVEDFHKSAGDKNADAQTRTKIIEYLTGLARSAYDSHEEAVKERVEAAGVGVETDLALRTIEKDIILRSIDTLWVEHLEAIDHLRAGIGLRGYGQHDPLVEYKKESYRLFTDLLAFINKQVVYSIYKIGGAAIAAQQKAARNFVYSAPAKSSNGDEATSTHENTAAKVGRNDPCPCGSGKKFKRCHGG